MSLILTYEDELYREPDSSYNDIVKIVKIIPKYDYKALTYKDKDANGFEIGDIVKLNTGEKLIFVCNTKKFTHLCDFDAIDEFNGTRRIVSREIHEKTGRLSDDLKVKLIGNIKEALEANEYISREIETKIKTLVM